VGVKGEYKGVSYFKVVMEKFQNKSYSSDLPDYKKFITCGIQTVRWVSIMKTFLALSIPSRYV
jgi:hypothetical protein